MKHPKCFYVNPSYLLLAEQIWVLSSEHLANAQSVDKLKGCLVSADSVCSERKTFKIASDTIQSTC